MRRASPPEDNAVDAAAPDLRSRTPAFVGRSLELGALEHALERVLTGRPALVLIEGEAGIGKTRLLREFRALATARGILVASGRSHENLNLPYLPFVRSLFATLEGSAQDIPDVAPYAAAVREYMRVTPDQRADGDRLSLFVAVSDGLLALAAAAPVLFVLDDLHWADASSLDLFEHICFAIADASERSSVPVMLVAAFRPLESTPAIERAVARLCREDICIEMKPARLEALEVDALLRSLGMERPAPRLVDSVTRVSQGNPFIVQEIAGYLRARGALKLEDGRTVSTAPEATFPLPAELTGPILERLGGVSEACRGLLILASHIDRPFTLELMASVAEQGPDAALSLLEEAMRADLISADADEFQFAHAAIRGAIYRSVAPLRRRKGHARIASALEHIYGSEAEAHVLEIAHHVVEAGAEIDPATALATCRQAGDRSRGLYAWGEAVRFYEAALQAARQRSDIELRDLRYDAGYVHHRAGNYEQAIVLYGESETAYLQAGEAQKLALVRAEMINARILMGGARPDTKPLEEALAALNEADPLLGKVCAELAQASQLAGDAASALEWSRRALANATLTGDRDTATKARVVLGARAAQALDLREATEQYADAIAAAREAGDPIVLSRPAQRAPAAWLAAGDLARAAAMAREGHDLGRQTGTLGGAALALGTLVSVDVLRGDFGEADRSAQEAAMLINRSAYQWAVPPVNLASAAGFARRGLWVEAAQSLDFAPVGRSDPAMYRQLVRALQAADAGERQETPIPARIRRRLDLDTAGEVCAAIELAAVAGAQIDTGGMTEALATAFEHGLVFTTGWPFLVPRILGLAAAQAGRDEDAIAWFGRAVEKAQASGAQAELALSYLDWATLAGRGTGIEARQQARGYAEKALPLLTRLGMGPHLREAHTLAHSLGIEVHSPPLAATAGRGTGRPGGAAAPPAEAEERKAVQTMAVVFFTDVVDSVPHTERLGDEGWLRLVQELHAQLAAAIRESAGILVEGVLLGDGLLATFTSARQAIECGFRCQSAAAALGVSLHVGLHAGDILREGGGISGGAVNIAARVLSECPPGEVFTSATVRELARTSAGVIFEDRGLRQLKGVAEPVRLFSARRG